MNRLPALLLLCVLLTAGLAGPPAAACAREVEEALPENTFMLVKVPDWSKTWKDMGETALGRIFAEEDVREYLKGLGDALREALAAAEKEGNFKLADLPAAYGTELVLVVTDLRMTGGKDSAPKDKEQDKDKGGKKADVQPSMTMALLARVGDEAAAARINTLVLKAMSEGAPAAEQLEWGALKVTRQQPPGKELLAAGKSSPRYFLRVGRWQMFAESDNEDAVRRLALGLAAGRCEKPLAESRDFKACRARLAGRADVFTYQSWGATFDLLLASEPADKREKAAAAMRALGLGEVRSTASTLAVEPPGFRSRSFLTARRGEEGLAGLFNCEPLPADFLRLAPPGSNLLLAGSLRTDRILPLLRKMEALGEDRAGSLEAGLAGLGRSAGLDIEKDLLAALGNRGCLLSMSSRAVGGNPLLGQVNGLVLAVEVRDAAAARRTLDRLLEKARAAAGARPDSVTINTFDYRGQKITGFDFKVVCPAVAATDKCMLVGGSVQAVKKVIGQLAAAPAEAPAALVADEKYRKAMSRVETKDALALAYFDVSDMVSTAMAGLALVGGFLTPFLDAGAPPALPGGEPGDPAGAEELAKAAPGLLKQLVNPAAMPPPEAITKHLFPAVASVRWVDDGLMTDEFSPLGFSGVGLVSPQFLGICTMAALPLMGLAGADKTEAGAAGSLRAYATAQVVFHKNDWDGNGVMEYAPDFPALSTTKDADGNTIQLIDAAFAAATKPEAPKQGYYFVNMKTIGGVKIDWVNDFALCAVPAVYGKTGYRTFIISTNGTVFGKDLGPAGKPVEDYPADPVKDGWIVAE